MNLKDGFKGFDWKKAGIIGIVLFLLSIPVMIWRSSRIGKVLYIILFLTIGVKASVYAIEKLSNAYFNVQGVFETRRDINPLLKEIEDIKKEVADQSRELNLFSVEFANRCQRSINQAEAEINKEKNRILDDLKEVESSIGVLREDQRDEVKRKIINLREEVKLKGHSIEEASIRERVEEVAKHLYLLTDEEKERFNKDLEEIGFKVKREKEKAVRIYAQSWGISTVDSVTVMNRSDRVNFADMEME